MAETTQERTERATPRKRQEARKKGTVARSVDLSSSFSLLLAAILLPIFGVGLALALKESVRAGLASPNSNFEIGAFANHVWVIVKPIIIAFIPFLLISLTGVVVSFAQVGFHFSSEPLNPKFERINPVEGIKRLFSRRSLFDFFKTLGKFFIIGYITWHDITNNWSGLLSLTYLTPNQAIPWIGSVIVSLLLKIACAWLVLGVLDYIFIRYQVERELRMTREEFKREMREQELSPELRIEMQRRRQRLARARMMANIKHADVVITNPIEYAVALKYDSKRFPAPIVLAKGRLRMAERIREEAKKKHIPIVANPPLARSLYEQVEIGEMIPTALFQAVAEVLAYVFRAKNRRL